MDLLNLLTYPDHAPAWEAIEHCLSNDHVVGDNVYPVRCAAGWVVVHRISRYPFENNLVPQAAIKATYLIDLQLAAPLADARCAVGRRLGRRNPGGPSRRQYL